MKKIMSLLMVFVLMPFMALAASLTIGNETFKPSDKNGYSYTFTSCSAVASYSEASGFKLTFPISTAITGNISWSGGEGLLVAIKSGVIVALSGSITSNYGGVLEINGPGRLQIVNGHIRPSSADIKLIGAVVEITAPVGKVAMTTRGAISVDLSLLSIAGHTKTVHAYKGISFRASMISILADELSSGAWDSFGAIDDGNGSGGGSGGVSICGCVLSIVEQCPEAAGIIARGPLAVYDSCVTMVSQGSCFKATSYTAGQEPCSVKFLDARVLAVSQNYHAVNVALSETEGIEGFFGDGKYVLGSASNRTAVIAGHIEVDGGELELCAPYEYGCEAKEFLMRNGSLKMVDSVDYSMVAREMFAEAAVMVAVGAYIKDWTTVHSDLLVNMLANFHVAITRAWTGRAEGVIAANRFCQTGGRIDQGSAYHGCAMQLDRATFLGSWTIPAFCGGSLKSDVDKYDPGIFSDKGYYETAPTNTLGQTLTRVDYEPYWVYAGTDEGVVVPAGYYRIRFVAESGGEQESLLCQPGHVYRLPTYTATPPAGKKFVGWRCLRTGKRYDDQLLVFNLGQSGETIVMTAIFESASERLAREGALYVVIDLSGGIDATTYPISYLSSVPKGGWSDEYKTKKMVLRRIEPGTFVMGGTAQGWTDVTAHRVTLSKAYYMGVFEVTQRQYQLITGKSPFELFVGDTRAANGLSYDIVRGSVSGSRWPLTATVDEGTVVSLLRKKTGLDTVDLPTEAEWEYACRAGTTTWLNNGSDEAYTAVGRIIPNYDDGAGGYEFLTAVGSYPANSWGLYDMHGNVSELCLDWHGAFSGTPETDPTGGKSGTYRVLRGGSWASGQYGEMGDMLSMSRSYVKPEKTSYLSKFEHWGGVGVGGGSTSYQPWEMLLPSGYLPDVGVRLAIR